MWVKIRKISNKRKHSCMIDSWSLFSFHKAHVFRNWKYSMSNYRPTNDMNMIIEHMSYNYLKFWSLVTWNDFFVFHLQTTKFTNNSFSHERGIHPTSHCKFLQLNYRQTKAVICSFSIKLFMFRFYTALCCIDLKSLSKLRFLICSTVSYVQKGGNWNPKIAFGDS